MSDEHKGDRIWLVLCTTTGVAVDVTLNKYSSILPGWAVLTLWGIPLILFVVWFWRVERTSAWVKHRFLEHPVSYALMFLILIPFGWQATATMISKLSSPSLPKTQLAPQTLAPTPQGASASVMQLTPDAPKPIPPTIARKPDAKPVAASPATTHPTQPQADAPAYIPPPPQTTVSAPNGIGIGGNNFGSATVNNIGYLRKTINPDALSAMSTLMAPFADGNDRSDLVMCQLGDSNSCSVAGQLVTMFRNAGWKLAGVGYAQGVFSEAPEPLLITVNPTGTFAPGQAITSNEGLPPGSFELANALKSVGINVGFTLDRKIPAGKFGIVVGSHP